MASFDSDGVTIDYLDEGEGFPVVLIHGFASNRTVNWANTSWVKTVVDSGRRAIALDNRGHGASQKLYEPERYATPLMAGDVVALLDHLAIEKAALLGYSMGARIAAFTALKAPDRIAALVLSGLASALVEGLEGGEEIAGALEAGSVDEVSDPNARGFRIFADLTKSDRRALAACIRAARQTLAQEEVAKIAAPTLVVAGDQDKIAGSPDALAAMIPGAQALSLEGRDHMTAVGDRTHKQRVLAFLDENGI